MGEMTCPRCGAQVGDGLLCVACADKCVNHLRSIAGYWPELQITLTRQSRMGGGGSKDRTPLLVSYGAFRVASYVQNQLQSWVRDLNLGDLGDWQEGCWCRPYEACRGRRWVPLADDPVEWCKWLDRRVMRIRMHPAADEIVAEFDYCEGLVFRAVERPADRISLGVCDTCGHGLDAEPGQDQVVCQRCERSGVITLPVDVSERRRDLMVRMDGMRVTRAEACSMVGVRPKTLDGWVRKGWVPSDPGGRVLLGDVRARFADMRRRVEATRCVVASEQRAS